MFLCTFLFSTKTLQKSNRSCSFLSSFVVVLPWHFNRWITTVTYVLVYLIRLLLLLVQDDLKKKSVPLCSPLKTCYWLPNWGQGDVCLNTCKLERENGSFLITHHMPKPLFSMLKKVFIKDKCSTDLERISADKVLSAQYRTGDKEYVTLFSVMLKIFSILFLKKVQPVSSKEFTY